MKRIFTTSVLFAAIVSVAYAEEQGENYVGVSVSRPTTNASSTGAAVVFGHHYNEHLSGEIAYEDSGAVKSAPEKTTAVSVAALGFVPIASDLEGYIRVGYASARSRNAESLSATHGDITYGAGIEYHVNDKYAMDLGWNRLRVGNGVEIPRANENSYLLTVVRSF